jgi:hypothetical protein
MLDEGSKPTVEYQQYFVLSELGVKVRVKHNAMVMLDARRITHFSTKPNLSVEEYRMYGTALVQSKRTLDAGESVSLQILLDLHQGWIDRRKVANPDVKKLVKNSEFEQDEPQTEQEIQQTQEQRHDHDHEHDQGEDKCQHQEPGQAKDQEQDFHQDHPQEQEKQQDLFPAAPSPLKKAVPVKCLCIINSCKEQKWTSKTNVVINILHTIHSLIVLGVLISFVLLV